MKRFWLDVVAFIGKYRDMVAPTAFAVLCVICGIVSIVASGVTTAYSVEYAGEQIALVKEKDVFDEYTITTNAVDIITDSGNFLKKLFKKKK